MILGNNSNHSNYNEFEHLESEDTDSLVRSLFYNGIRCLQMIIGIIGNGMTSKILRNLKVLKNGHILMIYLAISDILVNCMVPLATFTSVFNDT